MTAHPSLTEKEVLDRISREKLLKTNAEIARWVRLSGSADERAAFRYVRDRLDSYGLQTTWLEHPALISYPLDASLDVIDADGNTLASFRCLSHSFSASVENLTCEIVDLGFGQPADYAHVEARGKVVLINGLASPTAVLRAEQAGAIGEVFVNDDHLHNMIVSTVWGTPTPDSAERLPKTPAVSIVRGDGERLRQRLAIGTTRVRMITRVFKGWQTTPIVIGELRGAASDDFVLLSGHLDSWDFGAMDNGSANATMLEVARLLAQAKPQLYRGLRIAFWSGHSHGRYSGSTWYADHYWEELHDRCVAHVNVDSTGARGATFYGSFQTHMELADLGAQVISEQTGQTARPFRMGRAGDMSFNGVGIPALFMELSQVPLSDENTNYVSLSYGTEMGGTMPWWWHTFDDTMDKVDPTVLELDTRVYLSALWRLTCSPVLPIKLQPVVDDIQRELMDLQQVAGAHIDLGGLFDRLAVLGKRVDELTLRARSARNADEIAAVNRQIKAFSRVLIPATYTLAGQFDQDPAWRLPFLPSLQPARQLTNLDPDSDEYHFLKTTLNRSINAFSFALRLATESLGA